MRGPPFHDPLARCSLALPSFLLLRDDRVGLVTTIDYIIYSPLALRQLGRTLATMLLAGQIGSGSPQLSGLCRAAPPYDQARRVGLAGSWAHENAEWLSAMLGHAGIRNGICQTFHLGARGSSGRGESGLKGVEARESRGASFCFILLIFPSNLPF